MEAPQNPAGVYAPEENASTQRRNEYIEIIEAAPTALHSAVADLSESQIETRYRNWTIRQIVHHLADSHVNCYTRFRLALTEDQPTIKPYDESLWAALPDARTADIRPSLTLLEGLHARWVLLLRSMTNEQFARTFFHPESQQVVRLSSALGYYAWHSQHHTAQIRWLREQRGW